MLTQSVFLDACLGIVQKIKILVSANPKSLNLINNGDLTLQTERSIIEINKFLVTQKAPVLNQVQ